MPGRFGNQFRISTRKLVVCVESWTRCRRKRNGKQHGKRVKDLSCFTVRCYKWPVISSGPHKSEGVDVILISATNVTDTINTFRVRARLSPFKREQKYHPCLNFCRAAANGIYGSYSGKRILNRKQKKRKENRTFVRRVRVWLSLWYERDHFVTSEINGFPCASTATRSLHPFIDTKEWKYPSNYGTIWIFISSPNDFRFVFERWLGSEIFYEVREASNKFINLIITRNDSETVFL